MCSKVDPARVPVAGQVQRLLDIWFGDPDNFLNPTEIGIRRNDLERLKAELAADEMESARLRGRTLKLDEALELARAVSTP